MILLRLLCFVLCLQVFLLRPADTIRKIRGLEYVSKLLGKDG